MNETASTKTNDGYRLLMLLDELKQGPNSEDSDKALQRVFKLSDKSQIFLCQGELFTLANTVCKQLYTIPKCNEFFLRWIPDVYKLLFALRVNNNTSYFKEQYRNDIRIYLEGACIELERYYPGLQLNSEELDRLYKQIPIMVDAISKDNNIDQGMKNFINDRLKQIQIQILHSSVVGYTDLVTNIESTFSSTVFRVSLGKIRELKEKSKAFADYIDWVGRLLILFESGKIGYTALEAVSKYLLN